VLDGADWRGVHPGPMFAGRPLLWLGLQLGALVTVAAAAATAYAWRTAARDRLRLGGGDIEIVAAADGRFTITEAMRYTDERPHPRHRTGGGALTLESGCGDVAGNCGVDYRIEGPPAVAAQLRSAGGDVTLRLPSGDYAVDAATDGGRASVRVGRSSRAEHRVTIRSGGGDATVEPA